MTKKSTEKKLPTKTIELDHICVAGAREHNLKNIDINIPKKKFVVITGVSGSGKSSLAFDTIYAEGQRRYVESLSAYARQFIGQMEKPKYDTIRGLSPTIAIEQKSASKNPRSTVGTITEVYDYLRVLYARMGVQHCHICGKEVGRGDAQGMVEQLLKLPEETKIVVLAPIVDHRKGEHRDVIDRIKGDGFARVRIDGVIREIDDVQGLAKNKKHNLEVVIDRLKIKSDGSFKKRLTDSVELALKYGQGQFIVHRENSSDLRMSEERTCCEHAFPELNPQLFSFNSPQGMCPECNGLGSVVSVSEEKLVPDSRLTIAQGAVKPWADCFDQAGNKTKMSWGLALIEGMEKTWKLDIHQPWNKIAKKTRDWILHGCDDPRYQLKLFWEGQNSEFSWNTQYEGLIKRLTRLYIKHKVDGKDSWVGKYTSILACTTCQGLRLRPEVLAVKFAGHAIHEVSRMTIAEAHQFFKNMNMTGGQKLISEELLKEISGRLGFLVNVGLNYLSLDRPGPTLSGGEAQRIRLASQIGSELTGVLYILDEPSIGLHQRDNIKLINTLCHLRDIGNSLLVVEHDQETMEMCDWIIDMGPGAGLQGGEVIAQGTPSEIKKNPRSETGKYLSRIEEIMVPKIRREGKKWLTIVGARANNLKNIDVKIPMSVLTCVAGVSGAGKSTLINQILYPAIAKKLHDVEVEVGAHTRIDGLEEIDKIINIDQKPIGKTPRSNPATYTKVYDPIRDLFASLPEAKARGYEKGRFSFNVKGGRCEKCQGDGYITVEMHFLADVMVPCDECKTKRFNHSTLQVLFKGRSIADVLDLSVAEAREFFQNHPSITNILDTLMEVGLGYIKLGQAATTMSGGEAQRIKLSRELSKRGTGSTLYILDEPTTGLHFSDIRKLLTVLQKLVNAGNTVIVIEHNLDVIKSADWIIDIGPEGGHEGGRVVAEGTPEHVVRQKHSPTAQYLKGLL